MADAFFGVDNTFLTSALDANLFEPYTAKGLDGVPTDLQVDQEHRVTPIDHGDVCVNDDLGVVRPRRSPACARRRSPISRSRSTESLLVVENPVSSSPGLAFLLATIAANGDNGWQEYWQQLRDNGVRVVDGWEQAYYSDFTAGGGGGDRPLVVSYSTDPAADVVFSDGKKTTPTRRRGSGHVLRAGRVRRRAHERRQPGRRACVDRLHVDAPLPGRRAAPDVRLSGGRRALRCPRCSATSRSRRRMRTRCRRRRSGRTGGTGSTSGRRSCCSDPRLAARAGPPSRSPSSACSSSGRSRRSSAVRGLPARCATCSATKGSGTSRGSRSGSRSSRPS